MISQTNNHHKYGDDYGIVQSNINISNNPKELDMKSLTLITVATCALILGGCANQEGVTPSQNKSLHAISPSTTATSEGGAMQRSLDVWLKEEWNPIMAIQATNSTTKQSDGTVVTTKTEPTTITIKTETAEGKVIEKTTKATQITTTTQSASGKVESKTEMIPLDDENEPFTLQKYVDRWKIYHEAKAKMNEGKPKEPSHVEIMESLPVVGSNHK